MKSMKRLERDAEDAEKVLARLEEDAIPIKKFAASFDVLSKAFCEAVEKIIGDLPKSTGIEVADKHIKTIRDAFSMIDDRCVVAGGDAFKELEHEVLNGSREALERAREALEAAQDQERRASHIRSAAA
jgi:hypothetical protein